MTPKKGSKTRANEFDMTLRIVFVRPPTGVMFCVQGRPQEFFGRVVSTGADVAFEVPVRVVPTDPPRFLGVVAQGPPAERFVYVCSGTSAGDPTSPWTRRAKIPLASIKRTQVRAGGTLEVRVDGVAKDGGPACATVPLLGKGWSLAR